MSSSVHDGTAFDKVNMPYRRLGRTGLKVPIFSLGSWLTIGEGAPTKELCKLAFEHGINYFDTAECYSNGATEIELGQVIKELGWRRDEITIGTKVSPVRGRADR